MQSTGEEGRIQITAATRTLLETLGDDFVCEPEGFIDVKSNGSMETFLLFLKELREFNKQVTTCKMDINDYARILLNPI